jgi:hypothetical protein
MTTSSVIQLCSIRSNTPAVLPSGKCTQLQRSVRDAVLSGMDLLGSSFSAEDKFTGKDTFVRKGEVEPDCANFVIPITAVTKCGRPRRKGAGQSVPTDARDAVLSGFDLMGASSEAEDQFVWPHTVIRAAEFQFDEGWVMPFISRIKFGQPRGVPA